MGTRPTAKPANDVKRVSRQFEQWRSRRRPGARIPEPLWRAAVELAQRYGVSRTSLALRLDYYSLKGHVEAASPADAKSKPSGAFIEVPLPGMGRGSVCTLEVEDKRGVRLRMELEGIAGAELAGLVRAVWSGGQP